MISETFQPPDANESKQYPKSKDQPQLEFLQPENLHLPSLTTVLKLLLPNLKVQPHLLEHDKLQDFVHIFFSPLQTHCTTIHRKEAYTSLQVIYV